MRQIIIAASAFALALPAVAPAQSTQTFPEEMDEEIARALPHPEDVEVMADTAGRAAEALLDTPIGGLVNAIDPSRRVHRDDTIEDLSDDPYLRERVRDSVGGLAGGLNDVLAQVAVVTPALRRSLADLERNLEGAIYDARRSRDRRYHEDRR